MESRQKMWLYPFLLMDDLIKNTISTVLNDNKETEQQTTPPMPKAAGVVNTHNKSLWRKTVDILFAESFEDVKKSVVNDIIKPYLKDFLADMFIGGIERAIYGNNSGRSSHRSFTPPISSAVRQNPVRTSYQQYYASGTVVNPPQAQAVTTSSSLYDDVVMKDRVSAERLIDILNGRIGQYGRVTVNDLNDTLERTGKFNDAYFGWNSPIPLNLKRVYDGYLVIFPEPIELR
jgi:hypothetical protein